MCKAVICVIAAAAFLLSAGHTGAQVGVQGGPLERQLVPDPGDSTFCGDVVPFWIQLAKNARVYGCYKSGSAWSTDPREQGDFCLSAGDLGVVGRTSEMRKEIAVCSACSAAADLLVKAVIDNVVYKCGFTNPDGRWDAAPFDAGPIPKRESLYDMCAASFYKVQGQGLPPFAAEMLAQVKTCRYEHAFQKCSSCHNSQASPAVTALPKDRATLRSTITRVSPAPCLRCKSSNSVRKTPNVAGPGLLEGDQGFSAQGPAAAGSVASPRGYSRD